MPQQGEEKPDPDNMEMEHEVDNANGEEKADNGKDNDIPYSHLASFAIYKLFSSWDDGGKVCKFFRFITTFNICLKQA